MRFLLLLRLGLYDSRLLFRSVVIPPAEHHASPQVLFGTADGQVIVMDCHGRMLAHVLLHESDGIVSMSWNCPGFLVEDSTESDTDSDDNVLRLGRKSTLRSTQP